MIVKILDQCPEFVAGDKTLLRELVHGPNEKLKLNYSLAHATLRPNEKSLVHKLIQSSEVYYILEGEGIMHIDEEACRVKKDQAVYIPPGASQFIENTGEGDLKFLCIVDPAWKEEGEEVI